MIKVMWFLRRADYLSLQEFRSWWLEHHVPMVIEAYGTRLRKYVVNIRTDDDTLPGKPAEACEWDGCAEQWFETEADFTAAFAGASPSTPIRADTLRHVSRHARLIVREHEIGLND
jgi:uncharacterized protein (TIGR02118 family)